MPRDNKEYHKKYFQDHKVKKITERRNLRIKLRRQLLETLGGKCKKCGLSDERALQVDHIKGGGNQARRHHNGAYRSTYILKEAETDFKKFLSTYQLLCANCNWIKRSTNNEVRKSNLC